MLEKHGEHFKKKVFTPAEIEYAGKSKKTAQTFAARFAAKEAVLKLLRTGLRDGLKWTDIEITNDHLGAPSVTLSGRALELAGQMGICQVSISITHDQGFAAATAIAIAAVENL
ncbi:Holo-[acyl-carrier-protein] synthase [Limihaloglobus sulfuriphilus]|uniref:Holo-[acyl-carrier-protein] synthase n=2 Tax=Limihaloglobus sulfuriphilus TaxID=1851148 RepID=A0A1Q2MJ40_9BACT|nr:Holo-[acyl-carrier-protein] synthase [Limihaloglobus sulfuriphilus]